MKFFSGVQFFATLSVLNSLEVMQLDAPPYVKLGDNFNMTCYFDLEGDSLYSIKWFRGTDEIFSYIATLSGSGPSPTTTNIPGVHIQSSQVVPTSFSSLTLTNTSMHTSGQYQCEVSGDRPRFMSYTDTKHVTVAVPPEKPPEMWPIPANFAPGAFLSLNCSAYNTSAPVILRWKLNHEVVTDIEMLRKFTHHSEFGLTESGHNSHQMLRRWEDPRASSQGPDSGLQLHTVVLGLQFWVKRHHFKEGKMVVSCDASIPGLYNQSTETLVVGRYTEPLQFLETRSKAPRLTISLLFTLQPILSLTRWRLL